MNPFYELAKNLRDSGVDQKTIYKAFGDVFADCQSPKGIDDFYWEDDITDALDCISGYCALHMELFPDGMNWKEMEDESMTLSEKAKALDRAGWRLDYDRYYEMWYWEHRDPMMAGEKHRTVEEAYKHINIL